MIVGRTRAGGARGAPGQGLAGVTSALGSLYPLTTVALAWLLLLRERASLPQGVGVARALAGVALVSLGGSGLRRRALSSP